MCRRQSGRLDVLVLIACAATVILAALALFFGWHGRPLGLDSAVHGWAVEHRPDLARTIATAITYSGSGWPPYVVVLLAGAAVAGERVVRACGYVALLGAGQLGRYGLLEWVARARPPSRDWAVHAGGHAFPSGHTTTAALTAGMVIWSARTRRPGPGRLAVVCCAIGWAVLVGLSRIYLGVHWPTDVLGGWLFATAALSWTALAVALLNLRDTRETGGAEDHARAGGGGRRDHRP